jgi:hypothetical protein
VLAHVLLHKSRNRKLVQALRAEFNGVEATPSESRAAAPAL